MRVRQGCQRGLELGQGPVVVAQQLQQVTAQDAGPGPHLGNLVRLSRGKIAVQNLVGQGHCVWIVAQLLAGDSLGQEQICGENRPVDKRRRSRAEGFLRLLIEAGKA